MSDLDDKANESESPEPNLRRSPLGWVSGVVSGILAGVVIGWAVRGTIGARNVYVPPNREAREGGPPGLLQEEGRAPFTLQNSDGGTVSKKPEGKIPGSKGPGVPDGKAGSISNKVRTLEPVPAMPLPLPGSINASGAVVESPPVDLHTLEARLRVVCSEQEGKVVSVRDAKAASGATVRSIVISIAPERVEPFTERVRKVDGNSAMVEEPVASESGSEDSLKQAQLMSEQALLGQLKLKLHQAQLDFYPDAPALKTIETQYGEELKKVDDLRRSVKSSVTVTVVLAAGR